MFVVCIGFLNNVLKKHAWHSVSKSKKNGVINQKYRFSKLMHMRYFLTSEQVIKDKFMGIIKTLQD